MYTYHNKIFYHHCKWQSGSVDVTVRVVLFSTIAFVVNFLDNFFPQCLGALLLFHHTRGKFVFSFYIFFIFRKTATGFLLCYFASPMIFLLLFHFLGKENDFYRFWLGVDDDDTLLCLNFCLRINFMNSILL